MWTHTSAGAINRKREELWGLDMLGNWLSYQLDLDGDGSIGGLPELDEVRTHNAVNEILTRDVDNDLTVDHTLAHNPRGDLTDDGKDFQYVYDAFGRLRIVKNRSNSKVVAEYRYNALGYRIAERHDWNLDGEADGDDPTFHAIHDARWRRVGTVRSEGGVMDDEPKELWAFHAAGLAGLGGSSYLDGVIMRDRDTAAGWEEEASGTLGQRLYLLQNWRADVSVVINHDGSRVLEWVKYSAYGVPTLLAAYDADCNGVRNSTDLSVFSTLWTAGGSTYDVRADYNLDGTVNSTDLSAHTSDWQSGNSAIGRGFLSRSDSATKVFNRTGYAGYRWDPVVGSYHVRHRWLFPLLGQWATNDPLGFIDGVNRREYGGSAPFVFVDPSGQSRNIGASDYPTGPIVLPPGVFTPPDDNLEGPPRPEAGCCKEICARRPGPGRNGCCGGEVVACVCPDNESGERWPNNTYFSFPEPFRSQFLWCVALQELCISPMFDCTGSGPGDEPGYNPPFDDRCVRDAWKCNCVSAAADCVDAISCPSGEAGKTCRSLKLNELGPLRRAQQNLCAACL